MLDDLRQLEEEIRIREWLMDNLEPLLLRWVREELTDDEIILDINRLLERRDLPLERGYWSAPASDILRSIRQQIDLNSERYGRKAKAYFQDMNML